MRIARLGKRLIKGQFNSAVIYNNSCSIPICNSLSDYSTHTSFPGLVFIQLEQKDGDKKFVKSMHTWSAWYGLLTTDANMYSPDILFISFPSLLVCKTLTLIKNQLHLFAARDINSLFMALYPGLTCIIKAYTAVRYQRFIYIYIYHQP